MLATPLAKRPNVIIATGPIMPKPAVIATMNDLVPSLSLLNSFSASVANSMIGVAIFRNCSPSGISAALTSSIDFWNFVSGESSSFFSSRSATIASSSVLFLVSLRT